MLPRKQFLADFLSILHHWESNIISSSQPLHWESICQLDWIKSWKPHVWYHETCCFQMLPCFRGFRAELVWYPCNSDVTWDNSSISLYNRHQIYFFSLLIIINPLLLPLILKVFLTYSVGQWLHHSLITGISNLHNSSYSVAVFCPPLLLLHIASYHSIQGVNAKKCISGIIFWISLSYMYLHYIQNYFHILISLSLLQRTFQSILTIRAVCRSNLMYLFVCFFSDWV